MQVANAEVSYLKSPGGGIPIFSKDKPVRELNNKIKDFFSDKNGFNVIDGRIVFKDTERDITLNTNLAIQAENLTIKSVFELGQGQISIEIGNIKYHVTPNNSFIFEDEKTIYSKTDFITTGIILSRGYNRDNTIGSVAYLSTAGGSSGKNVSIKLPALIKITVHKGSTGTLGNWYWVRGSK